MNSRYFLYILTVTFITIAVWVVFDILHARAQTQIPEETKQLLEPIDPGINTQILDEF